MFAKYRYDLAAFLENPNAPGPVLCLFSCLVLARGCINSSTLIKVKPDGSGTIEQTMLMNMAALKGMMAGLDAKGQMKDDRPSTRPSSSATSSGSARACASSRRRR